PDKRNAPTCGPPAWHETLRPMVAAQGSRIRHASPRCARNAAIEPPRPTSYPTVPAPQANVAALAELGSRPSVERTMLLHLRLAEQPGEVVVSNLSNVGRNMKTGWRSGPRHTREFSLKKDESEDADDDLSLADIHALEWAELARDTGVNLIVANRTYGKAWLAELREAQPTGHMMIVAILRAIAARAGGAITRADVVAGDQAIERHLQESGLKVVPSNGVALEHNGEGIGHAKYSQSKSVALLWEKIGDTIYATFDDHAPIAYHRAIRCLRELRLGRAIPPTKARTSRNLIEKIQDPWKYKNRGFNPKDKYYK
ncbi:MAG: hypothetical protein K1X42_18045, partial [Opitutaceae bacterium]|nr:hypothetical protein [Opitutaceae bacterium]